MSGNGGGAITVQGVSKRFVLTNRKPGDLRELFNQRRAAAAARKGMVVEASTVPIIAEKGDVAGGNVTEGAGEFWALQDISFAVQSGQPVGIIGHNGSGKSTLLKLLTGIIKPTHGTIQVKGRVGALIEVGAGFHPDLTGRENIYLNGSILGLSRRDIAQKFDAIVDFAGLESFIDTPVKRYSSGMYMRLGFSVAAHTEPEVLLIDEVLAVGDTLFQNKCLDFLKRYVAKGGAVVFVAHSMPQVAKLCETCIWLDHGRIRQIGPADAVIEEYMTVVAEREELEFRRMYPGEWDAREAALLDTEQTARNAEELAAAQEQERREAQERAKQERRLDPTLGCILRVSLSGPDGVPHRHFQAGSEMHICIDYRFGRFMTRPIFGIDFFRRDGLHMFTTSNYDHNLDLEGTPGEGQVHLVVPALSFGEGEYSIRATFFPNTDAKDWFTRPEDEDTSVLFTVSAGRFAHGCTYLPITWGEQVAVPSSRQLDLQEERVLCETLKTNG